MGRTLLRALLIVLVSAAVGVAVNRLSPPARRLSYWRTPPPPLAPAKTVSLTEAETLWRTGRAVFLDARAPADYAAGHIPLAQNLPASSFEARYPAVAGSLTAEQPVVVYCDGVDCDLSHRLMEELGQVGITNVRVLVNGWTTWRQAGLPANQGEQP